jgi:hypothetical protein
VVKELQDKIDNADQTVQSFRKKLRKADTTERLRSARLQTEKMGTTYTLMLDRQVDLVREVHYCCS